jgi:hypothetical protein
MQTGVKCNRNVYNIYVAITLDPLDSHDILTILGKNFRLRKIFAMFLLLAVPVSHAATSAAIATGTYASIGVGNLMRSDMLNVSNWSNHFTFYRAPDNGNTAGLIFLAGYQKLINNFILNADTVYRLFPSQSSAHVSINAIYTPRVTTNST